MAKKLAWAAPIVFIGVLFYWPLATILSRGFTSNWIHDILDPKTLDVLWFTVWQAAVSTIFCLLLGVPGAYVLYRRKFKGQKLVRALITVPFMLPTIVVATAFSAFHKWNTTSALWIIVAHVFINYSLAVRTIGSQWSELDRATEEAAELAGAGRIRSFVSVTLPQLRGSFVVNGAVVLVLSLNPAISHTKFQPDEFKPCVDPKWQCPVRFKFAREPKHQPAVRAEQQQSCYRLSERRAPSIARA